MNVRTPQLFIASASFALGLNAPAHADSLLPPAGPWPTEIPTAPNPLLGTPSPVNGANASANVRLAVWLPVGRQRRDSVTRVAGGRTVIRGSLRNTDTRKAIGGAVLTLVNQNVYTGAWTKVGGTRTARNGRFRAVLPPGLTRRVAVTYWPAQISPAAISSRRLTVRSSAHVFLSAERRAGRRIVFRGRVSGAPVPSTRLRVAVQARNNLGRWVTLRLPLTDPAGRFVSSYRFSSRAPVVVRASVPSRQAGWLLYAGRSARVIARPR